MGDDGRMPRGARGRAWMKVAILDYGAGNLHSLAKVMTRDGVTATVETDLRVAALADALILPGVGAFGSAVAAIDRDREYVTDDVRRRDVAAEDDQPGGGGRRGD